MMQNTKIYLTEPRKFIIKQSEINIIPNGHCVVKPLSLSICKADLRYYNGQREEKVLKQKLPMVLIHEGIGIVQKSKSVYFQENEFVNIVPCIRYLSKETYYNNDYENTLFMSSNCDGLMQKHVKVSEDNLIKIPELKSEFSTLELGSVCLAALHKLKTHDIDLNNKKIVLFGTGALAYWMYSILRETTNSAITIVGNNKDKIKNFNCDNTIIFKDIKEEHNNIFDIAIEMVGKSTDSIINVCTKILKPNSNILLLGMDENNNKVNFRNIIQKGINIITSHRAITYDCDRINLCKMNMNKIVSKEILIKSIDDIYDAFNSSCKYQFKTVMNFSEYW